MDTQMINFSIPTTLLRQMDRLAKAESKTRSEFLREAIRRYLQKRQEQRRNIGSMPKEFVEILRRTET